MKEKEDYYKYMLFYCVVSECEFDNGKTFELTAIRMKVANSFSN